MLERYRSWGHNDNIDRNGNKLGDSNFDPDGRRSFDSNNHYRREFDPTRKEQSKDNFNPTPGFYQINKTKEDDHFIELEGPMKKIPDNIYGKTGDRVLRYWKKYIKISNTLSILLVGDKGSGKSLEADLLCNVAIEKGKMAVLAVTGFEVTEQTIQFLEHYDNVVLYFDEFSKHVRYQTQDLLLSLLTNTNKNYLVVMTENDINTISNYIRSRPGRAWYRKVFDKLELDIIEDYLKQYPKVTTKFKEELLDKYKTAMTFSFDHLKALVDEHLDYPEETIDEMLELLNIDIFSKSKKYFLTKVEKMKTSEELGDVNQYVDNIDEAYESVPFVDAELDPYQVEQDRYTVSIYLKPEPSKEHPEQNPMMGRPGMFNGMQPMGKEIRFNINNLLERDGATLVFKSGDYRFTMIKADATGVGNNRKNGFM